MKNLVLIGHPAFTNTRVQYFYKVPLVRSHFICMILFVFVCGQGGALAADGGPFSFHDNSNWVPLDQYDKHQGASAADAKKEPAQASAHAPEDQSVSPLAQPERPLQLPAMPNMNANAWVPATALGKEGGAAKSEDSSFGSEDRQWVDAREAARNGLTSIDVETAGSSLAIRFPALPSAQVKSIAAPRISQGKLAREAKAEAALAPQSPKIVASEKKLKSEIDACEAYTEFRRRQLQAIESDRKTLAQLKAVLTDLGLVDKLSFMNGTAEVVPAAANEAATASNEATPPTNVKIP